jgi:hypothetical protein
MNNALRKDGLAKEVWQGKKGRSINKKERKKEK